MSWMMGFTTQIQVWGEERGLHGSENDGSIPADRSFLLPERYLENWHSFTADSWVIEDCYIMGQDSDGPFEM